MLIAKLDNVPENRTILGADYVDQELVAELLGVTTMTILKWRTHKGLPFIQLGRNGRAPIKFDYDQVVEWARKNNVPVNTDVKKPSNLAF